MPWSLIKILGLGMAPAISMAVVSIGAGYAMTYAKPWVPWPATIASLLLIIAGFPWLTVPGIFVLFTLAGPPKEQPQVHKKSGGAAPWWISPISGALLIFGWGFMLRQGESLGLAATAFRPWILLIWFCGSRADITVHELGHTLAAWAVGFRVRSICIGPLVMWNHPDKGRLFEWQWRRLFVQSGYVGCIPRSEDRVRWNMIFIVLCGPLISLIAGLGFFSMLLAAPGSPWEQYWEVLGTLALIFVVDSLVNLVPAGELDGARLLQLVTRSEKGKSYLAALRSGKVDPTIGTALNTPPLPSR
jgi:Zn-dependent protease